MAKFTRVEVHFPNQDRDERIAVVLADNAVGNVDAIFLNGSESQFFPKDKLPKTKTRPPKGVVEILPQDDVRLVDGPQVCYLVNGQLFCW